MFMTTMATITITDNKCFTTSAEQQIDLKESQEPGSVETPKNPCKCEFFPVDNEEPRIF